MTSPVTIDETEASVAPTGAVRTLRFKLGEAFPANDPVARFITVVATMSNDWLRLINEMLAIDDDDPDEPARRIMSFRQQAALHHEAAKFMTDTRRRFPEIDRFIAGLEPEGRAEYDQITAGMDPTSPHYLGDWFADHRNVTFHYPEMHPDKAADGRRSTRRSRRPLSWKARSRPATTSEACGSASPMRSQSSGCPMRKRSRT